MWNSDARVASGLLLSPSSELHEIREHIFGLSIYLCSTCSCFALLALLWFACCLVLLPIHVDLLCFQVIRSLLPPFPLRAPPLPALLTSCTTLRDFAQRLVKNSSSSSSSSRLKQQHQLKASRLVPPLARWPSFPYPPSFQGLEGFLFWRVRSNFPLHGPSLVALLLASGVAVGGKQRAPRHRRDPVHLR